MGESAGRGVVHGRTDFADFAKEPGAETTNTRVSDGRLPDTWLQAAQQMSVYENTPDRPKAETPAARTHNDCTTPVRAPGPTIRIRPLALEVTRW